jgi:predicted phosphoribosyltransferase
MGAIASGGVQVLNHRVVQQSGIAPSAIEMVAARERRELERRERVYRGGGPAPELRERAVILVDDGIATGSTMRAAVKALRHLHAARIVVATPVAARDAVEAMRPEVDDLVVVMTPHNFSAVGEWYEEFSQTTDEEVRSLLASAGGLPRQHEQLNPTHT